MRRLMAVLLLTACWAGAKHSMVINSVVGRLRPGCQSITHAQDETEDWLWWVNACGEMLWCRHDERGEMVCGARDELPVSTDVAEVARFVAHCPARDIIGRKEVNRAAWHLSLCGHALDCELFGGAWTCRDRS